MFDYKRRLDVGNQVAENDWAQLKNHFVTIETSEFVGQNSPSIILGRKGSGKSALRLHFERTTTKQQRAVSIQPSSDDLHGAFSYVLESNKDGFSVEFISRLWELTVLINLYMLVMKDDNRTKRVDNDLELPPGVTEDLEAGRRYGIGRTLEIISRYYQDDDKRARLARNLRSYIKAVIDGNELSYFVLIDSIDDIIHNSLDTTKRSDLFATFFEGLLSYFRNFVNLERNLLADRIHLHIFIPIDIFNWSVNRHADHLRQYKHSVSWERHHLDEFITSRLLPNLTPADQSTIRQIKGDDEKRNQIWREFFPQYLSHFVYLSRRVTRIERTARDVLISMTLRRPRDLQEIVRLIGEKTRSSRANFPTEKTINAALDVYSIELRQSVEKEYELAFPEISDVLSKFAGNSPNIAKNTLMDLVGDVVGHSEQLIYRALYILYEACIIGAAHGKQTNNAAATFYYDFQDFRAIYSHHDEFVVHIGFWHALQLSSLRFSRTGMMPYG